MKVLTIENKAFELNYVQPAEFAEGFRFSILNFSNPKDVDYHFIPMISIEQFTRPVAELNIAGYTLKVPLDWHLLCTDPDTSAVDMIALKHFNDRDFHAFVYNPVTTPIRKAMEVVMENIYPDVAWSFPRLIRGHVLTVPLNDKPNPPCVFIVKDCAKTCYENMDMSQLIV